MKAKHLLFALFALSLGATACENDNTEVQQPSEPKTYTVSLDISGEIEVSQNPLTRFTPDDRDLYGIQVDCAPNSGGNYKHYAYGLFDDINNINIELIENHKYRFTLLLINDGKDKIYDDVITIDEIDHVGYNTPYNTYLKETSSRVVTPVFNEFIITEDVYFNSFTEGYRLKGEDNIRYAVEDLDVFYGITEDYTPTADNDTVSIFLKRMIFGLKVVENNFLTDGQITIDVAYVRASYDGLYHHERIGQVFDKIILSPDTAESSQIYAYSNLVDEFHGKYPGNNISTMDSWYRYDELDDAIAHIFVTIAWERGDGTIIKWNDKMIQINRLKESVINLSYYEDGTKDTNLSLVYEDYDISEGVIYEYGGEQGDYKW